MSYRINRPVLDLGTRRVFAEKVVAFPVLDRPYRPRNEPAATVWTDVTQDAVDTGCAERALISANARFK